jgi:hypothetical protein
VQGKPGPGAREIRRSHDSHDAAIIAHNRQGADALGQHHACSTLDRMCLAYHLHRRRHDIVRLRRGEGRIDGASRQDLPGSRPAQEIRSADEDEDCPDHNPYHPFHGSPLIMPCRVAARAAAFATAPSDGRWGAWWNISYTKDVLQRRNEKFFTLSSKAGSNVVESAAILMEFAAAPARVLGEARQTHPRHRARWRRHHLPVLAGPGESSPRPAELVKWASCRLDRVRLPEPGCPSRGLHLRTWLSW